MPKFTELLEKVKKGEPLDESNSKDPSDWWSKQIGYKISEDAPPGMEGWIKDRKAEFKKRYGKRWEEVLYATAWKMKDKIKDSKGGGGNQGIKTSLRDEMGASSEGEIAGQAYSSHDAPPSAFDFDYWTGVDDEDEVVLDALGGIPEGTKKFYIYRPDKFGVDDIGVGGYTWSHRDPRTHSERGVTSTSATTHGGDPKSIARRLRKTYGNDVEFEVIEGTGAETNITRSGPGTGTPHSPWVATDALPDVPLQYDYDQTKLPESNTLAATKGIKSTSHKDDEGKKVKMMKDPDGGKGRDHRDFVKDVHGADNLSDEAMSPEMKNSAYETIRVDHVTKGRGTVLEIAESYIEIDWDRSSLRILGPEKIPFSETKYLTRIQERYSDSPEDVDVDSEEEPKGIKKMAKKQKVDEAMVAIKPTLRNTGDGYKLPVIDLSPEDIGMVVEYDLPDPGDSVLTGQDQQKAPKIEPLSTERGADAAHDDIYPDGDFAKDLVPDDAPDTPGYEQMGADAGNPRDTDGTDNPAADVGSNSSGESSSHEPADYDEKKYGDSDKSSDNKVTGGSDDSSDSDDSDDDEDEKVKESKIDLAWEDIGLDITEVAGTMSDFDKDYMGEDETCEGCGDMAMDETHDTGAGEVAFTPELLHKLMVAVRDKSPEDDKIQRMCDALKDASSEKGATLDDSDLGNIMDKYKNGGGAAPEAGAEESMAGGDVRGKRHGAVSRDGENVRDDDYGDAASKYQGKAWNHESEGEDEEEDEREDGKSDREYQEQDKAEGDGEEAGPEGGDEHEGKTKLMDRKGKKHDMDGDGDEDSDDWKMSRDKAIKGNQRRAERKEKQKGKYASMETKGGKKIKPVSQNTSKGSGPGGGNVSNDGQEMLIPEYPDGNERGTPGTPLSKEGGGRTVKPVSESVVGMAPIGGVARDVERRDDEEGLTEEEKELRMIKRRAGLKDWWK